ncbi:hypothetical protein V1509DRAFT_636197 [Lipomyces kononenkoae]
MNPQSLRQTVALLGQHAGHLNAVKNASLNFVDDVQSGHTSHVATTYYAIGTDDLPSANKNDVQEFLNVSDRWIQFLGLTTSTSVVDDQTTKTDLQQTVTRELLSLSRRRAIILLRVSSSTRRIPYSDIGTFVRAFPYLLS